MYIEYSQNKDKIMNKMINPVIICELLHIHACGIVNYCISMHVHKHSTVQTNLTFCSSHICDITSVAQALMTNLLDGQSWLLS